jgi:xanthosine utilization system XapX-like protein
VIGAFFRLGFTTACCAFVFALAEVAIHTTVAVAVIVGVVGVLVALVLSEEWSDRAGGK